MTKLPDVPQRVPLRKHRGEIAPPEPNYKEFDEYFEAISKLAGTELDERMRDAHVGGNITIAREAKTSGDNPLASLETTEMPDDAVRHEPPPTDLGQNIGRFVIDDPDDGEVTLQYRDHVGLWYLDLSPEKPGDRIAERLLDACADAALHRGVRLVATDQPLAGLLDGPYRHVRNAPPSPRTKTERQTDVPADLARFCARVARWLKSGDAVVRTPEGDSSRDVIGTSKGEAISEFSGTEATITWYPNNESSPYGWVPRTIWKFDGDIALFESVGSGEISTIRLEETVIQTDRESVRQDIEDILDDWVADGSILLEGDPQGKQRTLALQRLADKLTDWMLEAFHIDQKDQRKQAAADLAQQLMDIDSVEELFVTDLELYWMLRESLWSLGE